ADVRVGNLRLRNGQKGRDRGGETAEHEYAHADSAHAEPGKLGRATVAAHRVDVEAGGRAPQHEGACEREPDEHRGVVGDVTPDLPGTEIPEGGLLRERADRVAVRELICDPAVDAQHPER